MSSTTRMSTPARSAKRGRSTSVSKKSVKQTNKKPYTALRKDVLDRVYLGLGFPLQSVMKHRFTQSMLSTGLGAINFQNFSCNGMYDPWLSGVGLQPLHFDQMSALYDHYTVINCKIKVTWYSVESGQPQMVGVMVNDTTGFASIADYEIAAEQTQSLGSLIYVTANQNSGIKPIIAGNWNAKTIFGKDPLDNDEMKGSSSANPVEDQIFTIWTQPMDKASGYSVSAFVELEYTAVWTELKKVSAS